MRTRTPAALAIVGALALAACGSDDGSTETAAPATEAATEAADDDMSDDMTDDDMADDDMSDDMSDDMADDDMADDDMSDDDMSDDDMADDDMSDDDMSDDMSDDDMAAADGDIVAVAAGRDDLGTLVAAVEAAGLAETLSGDGPFTVFAPTDQAFEDYLGEMGMSADDLIADTQGLTTILQAHVVSTADDSDMVAGMVDNPFVTLAGTELPVEVDGDTITVGGAEIVEADIFATNGVIHVIDTVLVPS